MCRSSLPATFEKIVMTFLMLLGLWAADEPREVLCLYNAEEHRTPQDCETHLYAEVVLNHLGLIAVYHDVNDPLPADEKMARFRGILTWFTGSRLRRSYDYWKWIDRQARAGRKIAILGSLGATYNISPDAVNEGLAALGLRYFGDETDNPTVLEVVSRGPGIGYERAPEGELRGFVRIVSRPSNTVHLKVRRTDLQDSESDLVVLGSWGGFAWNPVHYDPVIDRNQWRLDPFLFLGRALGAESLPKLDVTTRMGRRVLFATVGGAGFSSPVQPGPNVGRLAAEVIRDYALKTVDLPFTVSIAAADAEGAPDLARTIAGLPNVQLALYGTGAGSPESAIDAERSRLNRVCPQAVTAYLWSSPAEADPASLVGACQALHLSHLFLSPPARRRNGDSIAPVAPATTPLGGLLLLNARAMSENEYTDGGRINAFAYRGVIAGYRRSDEPRRLAPVHLFFHWRLADRPAGEAALREVLAWVRSQELYPMTLSEYEASVEGFQSARIERSGDRAWTFSRYGACRTVRFDDEADGVDLARSRNVLGFRRRGPALYVHLAPADEATIVLGKGAPDRPYLVQANGEWKDGKVVSLTAAEAVFDGPRGTVERKGPGHTLEVEFR